MNTVLVATILAVAIELIKRGFAFWGRPLSPSVQFLISLVSPLVPILAGGSIGTVTETVETFAQLFAAVQAVYNVIKQISRLFRAS